LWVISWQKLLAAHPASGSSSSRHPLNLTRDAQPKEYPTRNLATLWGHRRAPQAAPPSVALYQLRASSYHSASV